MAWRSEPAPLSLVLITKNVEGTTRHSSNSTAGRTNRSPGAIFHRASLVLRIRFATHFRSTGKTIVAPLCSETVNRMNPALINKLSWGRLIYATRLNHGCASANTRTGSGDFKRNLKSGRRHDNLQHQTNDGRDVSAIL